MPYTQGTDIHVAPGQERHLPHEAWHVVQQAQGRVKPTMQMKGGVDINDDQSLEEEADLMGAKISSLSKIVTSLQNSQNEKFKFGEGSLNGETVHDGSGYKKPQLVQSQEKVIQKMVGFEFETGWHVDFVDKSSGTIKKVLLQKKT